MISYVTQSYQSWNMSSQNMKIKRKKICAGQVVNPAVYLFFCHLWPLLWLCHRFLSLLCFRLWTASFFIICYRWYVKYHINIQINYSAHEISQSKQDKKKSFVSMRRTLLLIYKLKDKFISKIGLRNIQLLRSHYNNC